MTALVLDPLSLPYGTEFRDVDGQPVAFVPAPNGDLVSVTFDGRTPRPYPMISADENGTLISREAFIALVTASKVLIAS